MNKESRDRHTIYLQRITDKMSDGVERSSKECHAFIDSPDPRDVAKILNRIKIEMTETRSRYRLKKRVAGREAFWTLEIREPKKMRPNR